MLHPDGEEDRFPVTLKVTKQKLEVAIQAVGDFCSYLENIWKGR